MSLKVTHATFLLQPATHVNSRLRSHFVLTGSRTIRADGESDDADLWAMRVRVERGPDAARYIIDLNDGRIFVLLRGEPQPLTADDDALEIEGEQAAQSWLTHVHRRFPPSRRYQHSHSSERGGQVAA